MLHGPVQGLSPQGPRPAPRLASQGRSRPNQIPQRGLHFQRPRTPARLSVRLRTYRPGGKAAIWIWHRLELRPLGAPGRGRGKQPEPKGDPTEPEGQPWPDKDNFQVPWSSPPIGMLGGRRTPERDFPRCGRGAGQGWGVGCGVSLRFGLQLRVFRGMRVPALFSVAVVTQGSHRPPPAWA